MEPDVAGVLNQFKSIYAHAIAFHKGLMQRSRPDYQDEVKVLVEEFNQAKVDFDKIRRKREIDVYLITILLPSYLNYGGQKALLTKIKIQCDKAIGVLESIALPLSKTDLDKLTTLRTELNKLSEVLADVNYERNINDAINEYEQGHYLASSLISGRVIKYAMDQIPGDSDKDKVKFLREEGIIEKGRKDVQESILKASRKARNFFSHDIKVYPTPSEALSLLSEAFGILKIVSKL